MAEQQTEQAAEALIVKKRVVLIPVDGSEHSEKAFDFYNDVLHRDGDYVVILNVPEVQPLPIAPYPYGGSAEYMGEWRESMRKIDEESKECLKSYGSKLRKKFHEQNFKLVKDMGKPGEVVVDNAVQEKADLVVMGSRGLGVIRRTFLGSVSEYVLHHCDMPVCIVRH